MRMARALWAGVMISLIAFAWAAHYLVRLARDTIGEPRAPAAVALMAAYPFAVFFSAPYTESLFVLGAIAAFYHCRRAEWLQAAAWGFLVGPDPSERLLPHACAAMSGRRSRAGARASGDWIDAATVKAGLSAVAAPVLGMLVYSAYVHQVTGSWFGWARLHEAWGRSFAGVAPIMRSLSSLTSASSTNEGLLRLIGDAPLRRLECDRA